MASDPDRSDSDDEAPTSTIYNRSGGTDIVAERVDITGDFVGRYKIVGYTIDQV